MPGREPSEARGDSYASTAFELLQLFTQTKAPLKLFKVFKGFTVDPGRKSRSNNPYIVLRVHWNAADSARGVFGVQAMHDDLAVLAVQLRRVYLTITDMDVGEWYPSILDLQNHYIDLNLQRFGVGRVLIHTQRGPAVKNMFEMQP